MKILSSFTHPQVVEQHVGNQTVDVPHWLPQ